LGSVPGSQPGSARSAASIRSLARKGALKEGLPEATATDIMWAIANPNTHYALISERQWTPGQYEQWLAYMLTCALLTSGP
jgi:hypothetical protein